MSEHTIQNTRLDDETCGLALALLRVLIRADVDLECRLDALALAASAHIVHSAGVNSGPKSADFERLFRERYNGFRQDRELTEAEGGA